MDRVVLRMGFSLIACSVLWAEDVTLETIDVLEQGSTTILKDIAGSDVRSADLADALYKLDPNVQLIRRSGIANDVIVRGMRKDNINVLIDGGKLYGGCPNRMDPPISHVLSNNVDNIVVKEGPYDVQHFGTLTGLVAVQTLKPSKEFVREINLNVGRWNYTKLGAKVSGGNDRIRVLAGGSTESGSQYKDGKGRTLAEQVADFAHSNPSNAKVQGAQYAPSYDDMDAFEKKTGMLKLYVDVAPNQQLAASYTYNHSTDVLYPNTPMDAREDTSYLFNIQYTLQHLGRWSKKVQLEFYHSWVYHPMGTYFRKSALGAMGVVENVMDSRIYGGSVKNSFDWMGSEVILGMDGSQRSWNGEYHRNYADWITAAMDGKSIDHYRAKQAGLFAQLNRRIGLWEIETGLRYDGAKVRSDDKGVEERSYDAASGYLFGTYHATEIAQFFGGIGASARIPDGKELYFTTNPAQGGKMVGTPDLKQVKNYQLDLGVETMPSEEMSIRVRGFYSRLKDFIFFNASKMEHQYENKDARLYGFSCDGTYAISDTIYFDGGLAYLRGKKDDPLSGQSDTDMPNITPLKFNLAANWDFDESGSMRLAMVAAKGWSSYDGENGEQPLGGYAVFNFKVTKDFADYYRLSLGMDNIFDKAYAMSNTYADMTLVTGGEPMLIHEPGRYLYAQLSMRF